MSVGMMIAERYGEFEAGRALTLDQILPDPVPYLSSMASMAAETASSVLGAVLALVLAYGRVAPWWIWPALVVVVAMSITMSKTRPLR